MKKYRNGPEKMGKEKNCRKMGKKERPSKIECGRARRKLEKSRKVGEGDGLGCWNG